MYFLILVKIYPDNFLQLFQSAIYMHKCLSCPEFSSYLEISLSSYLIKPYTSVCTHSSKIRILCSTILKSFALNSTFKVKQWKFELLHIISWTWEWWYVQKVAILNYVFLFTNVLYIWIFAPSTTSLPTSAHSNIGGDDLSVSLS